MILVFTSKKRRFPYKIYENQRYINDYDTGGRGRTDTPEGTRF
jgi:hypothetical protein